MKPVYAVCCMAAYFVLAPSGAVALDANIEEAFLHIIAADDVDPPWDPYTRDKDENGIVDLAHIRLFDTVLRQDNAIFHNLVLGVYTLNHLQVQRDNTLGSKCILLEWIYHFTCDEYERFAAATFTMNEPVGVEDMVAALDGQANIQIDLNDYNLSLGYLLNAAGDLDLDRYSNLEEYQAVCGNIEAFIAAALDPTITPKTVPCCRNCPLVITQQPQGTWMYTGGSHTFTIAVEGADGILHYQWVKNNFPIGTDSSTLTLANLQPSDSGNYQCVVMDEAETILSDITELRVEDHMTIARQPESATMEEGSPYTLRIDVQGGLSVVHYYWRKDGTRVGKDKNELVFTKLALSDSGVYWCEMADAMEDIVSEQVLLTVLPANEGEGQIEGEGLLEGQPEGEMEGEGAVEGQPEGEGVIEGQPEGEGVPEGQLEGQPEGEGVPEGQLEGQPEGEGVPEGQLEGQPEGEGVPEGQLEGQPEGEGVPEGQLEGQPEGEGVPEGQLEGQPEGEGMIEGQSEGEGVPEGHLEGQPEGEGTLEGQLEGQPEGEGVIEGQDEGVNEGVAEGQGEGEGEEGEGQMEEGEDEGGMEGEGEEEGIMSVTPADGSLMVFDRTSFKTHAHKSVLVRNTGSGSLEVYARMIEGSAFSIEGSPRFRLNAGGQTTVELTFTPVENRWYSDALTLEGGGARVILYLSGEGANPPLWSCSGASNPNRPAAEDVAWMVFTALALLFSARTKQKCPANQ